MACFQIIHVDLRSESCPNLNRKSVIRASKVLCPKYPEIIFSSEFQLFHQDFIFSIRISSFPSGFHHADAGPWSRPAAHNDGQADLGPHWELQSYPGLPSEKYEIVSIWLFLASNSMCSNFPDLQPSRSRILVSPRLLCQPYFLLPQPLGRQNCSTSMGLTKFLHLGLVRIVDLNQWKLTFTFL